MRIDCPICDHATTLIETRNSDNEIIAACPECGGVWRALHVELRRITDPRRELS